MRVAKVTLLLGASAVAAAAGSALAEGHGQSGGSRLVYAIWGRSPQPEIFIANGDGSESKLVPTSRAATYPSLSPDRRRIVYQAGHGGGPVVVVNVDGTSPRVVAAKGSHPRWSKDGKHIAYRIDDKGIYVVRPDGSHRRLLVRGQHLYLGDWTPQGEVTYPCRHGTSGVCAASLSGHQRHLVGFGSGVALTFSPNGARVAIEYGGGLSVANADGTHQHQLLQIAYRNTDCEVAWSPDGNRLAVSPVEKGPLELVNVVTGKRTALPGTNGACGVSWR